MSPRPLPPGFTLRGGSRGSLLADARHVEGLVALGLGQEEGWRSRLGGAAAGVSRGTTARLRLPDGPVLRLKQLRRGGWTAALWRDRFAGAGRLLGNLTVPLETARRGVPTPAPVALFLRAGPPGLYRGWLALEEIEGALDLGRRFVTASPPGRRQLETILGVVRRMHDRGVEHRDLHLSNLLLREGPRGDEVWVIDLDGARLRDEPLSFSARQRALRRLERSYHKLVHRACELPGSEPAWYALYAGEDTGLAARLERGRAVGRMWLGLHRLGWRR